METDVGEQDGVKLARPEDAGERGGRKEGEERRKREKV